MVYTYVSYIQPYAYTYVYIYIYIHVQRQIDRSICIYIYIYIYKGGHELLVAERPIPGAVIGHSSKGGAVGGGCSGWGQYYIISQCITSYKSLHPVSTAPPFAECRVIAIVAGSSNSVSIICTSQSISNSNTYTELLVAERPIPGAVIEKQQQLVVFM